VKQSIDLLRFGPVYHSREVLIDQLVFYWTSVVLFIDGTFTHLSNEELFCIESLWVFLTQITQNYSIMTLWEK